MNSRKIRIKNNPILDSHRHSVSLDGFRGDSDDGFTNNAEKTISISGVRSSSRPKNFVMTRSGITDNNISSLPVFKRFYKKFGEHLSMSSDLNGYSDWDGKEGKYELCLNSDTNRDVDMFCATGSVEECCDKTMIFIKEQISMLDKMKEQLQQAFDFLSDTMLGNGELSDEVESFENNERRFKKETAGDLNEKETDENDDEEGK